ncbi:MAG: hypothetical protein JKX74_00005, partial [Flavobacteriales bacterium]|nr:hypothetical protein [Flavobacteriales bacterium]
MKRALYIWLCILIPYTGFGQLTNDWIDYNKQYYKIKVYQDGVYRIDYSTLQLAGIPISSINRQDFQIYGRGKELYIYVAGAPASSALGAGDYIEFYGEKNTGWLDTAFYEDPTWHANPNISLFTDSATYFLTWETTTNRRLTEETNMNFLGKTSENYFMFESRADYFDTPYGGPYFLASGLALYESGITEAQGWSGPAFTSAITLSVPTTNVYTGGPMATASAGLIGANLNNHNVTVSVASVGSTVSYSSIKANKLSYNANPANLGSLSTNFLFSPQPSVNDRNTVAFVALEYPHTMNLGGVSSMHMDIPDASGDTAYLNLTNFNDQGQTTWLYDLDNYRRIAVGDNGSAHEVLVPNSGTSKRCFLFSESTITVVTTLVSVGDSGNGLFTDYAASPHDSAYLIVYNRKLEDDGNGNNFIQEYINYRTSPDGGGFDVVEADIDQLYDQFSYGIRKNPMAIRGFAEYTLTSPDWPTKPQNLLILGKGVSHRWSRSTSIYYDRVLVPTYGWPSSDNLLTAGLDGTLYAPAIPTGRIAAATGFEVGEYLNKVEEFDANQDTSYLEQLIELEEWKKQLMFFAGGTGSEHTQFRTFLKGYENIMEDTLFGGKIHQYNKNSSALIQITTSDSIENLINNGVTILQFFGHASGSGFDQNIDNPDVYQNTNGKYPLLIANSCLVGDIHQPQYESNSEDWVLHPRGTIGFLASVHFGEPGPLNEYTIELYRNMGQLMYGKSIGAIIQQTIKDVEDPSGNNSDNLRETCLLMTLHGDPAMVMNTRSLPDYAIRKRDVYTTPEIVSSEVDSFDLNLIVTNIGKAINTEIGIKITRRFPESATPEQDTTIVAYNIYYKDTLTVRLPVDLANGVGTNNFEIRIDDIGAVDEIDDYLNNNIVYPLLIRSDDLIPIYPYEFAVVPDKMQTLKASTGNPFAPDAVYHFQVDTSDAFSPPLAEDSMGQSGGVVEWKPEGNTLEAIFSSAADSTVFFWRVRRDSLWRESSFQYIQGKRGWGQAHFHQFKNDEYNLIEYNKPGRSFDYVTAPKELWCQTVGDATTTPDWLKTEYRINGSVQIASSCGAAPAVLVAVIDPLTLEPATSNCGTANIPISVFQITFPSEQANLANYLDAVPNGFYILAYSFYKGLVDTWSNALISEFQSLGWNSIADSIKTPGNLKPFIYFV